MSCNLKTEGSHEASRRDENNVQKVPRKLGRIFTSGVYLNTIFVYLVCISLDIMLFSMQVQEAAFKLLFLLLVMLSLYVT